MKLKLTVTETIKGGKLIALTAAKRSKKPTKNIVVVGTATVSIVAGQSKTLQISLNRAGKRLLTKYHKLTAKFVITAPAVKSRVVLIRTITFSPAPRKKHKA